MECESCRLVGCFYFVLWTVFLLRTLAMIKQGGRSIQLCLPHEFKGRGWMRARRWAQLSTSHPLTWNPQEGGETFPLQQLACGGLEWEGWENDGLAWSATPFPSSSLCGDPSSHTLCSCNTYPVSEQVLGIQRQRWTSSKSRIPKTPFPFCPSRSSPDVSCTKPKPPVHMCEFKTAPTHRRPCQEGSLHFLLYWHLLPRVPPSLLLVGTPTPSH